METIDTSNMNETEPTKRPTFLTVLCILTFIFAGITCLYSLFAPLIADKMMEFLKMNPNATQAQIDDAAKAINAGWAYYAPAFLLALLSLVGAILMWGLKKLGFHLYTASNLALLFLPMVMLGLPISPFAIFLTIAFIGMYAINLKHLS